MNGRYDPVEVVRAVVVVRGGFVPSRGVELTEIPGKACRWHLLRRTVTSALAACDR